MEPNSVSATGWKRPRTCLGNWNSAAPVASGQNASHPWKYVGIPWECDCFPGARSQNRWVSHCPGVSKCPGKTRWLSLDHPHHPKCRREYLSGHVTNSLQNGGASSIPDMRLWLLYINKCIYVWCVYIYIYMSSGQNYVLNVMPCTNSGRPLSVLRISIFPEVSQMGVSV